MHPALLTGGLLIYFVGQLCFFALKLSPDIPPDEVTHLGLSVAFSHAALIPPDGPETWRLGAIGGQPFLYYLIMGKLLHLNVLSLSDLLFLRLLNVLLGVGTVLYALRWLELFAVSRWARVLFLVMATNVLMFSGLAAAVSYDNLVNLLAAMCFFHLFRWRQTRAPADLLWLGGAAFAGCLTKQTFLPLAAILAAVLLLWSAPAWRESLARLRAWRPAGRGAAAGLTAVALLAAANLWLYGGNLVAHGQLVPSMTQVTGGDSALQNRVVARNRILTAFREGEISFEQANALAGRIAHEGDRRSTRALLAITRRTGDARMGWPAYLYTWTRHMLSRTFGYWGHRSIRPPGSTGAVHLALLAVAAALFASPRRALLARPGIGIAGLMALAYVAVLLFGVNHPNYMRTGLPDLAVQGRYLFPVFVPLCGVTAVAWTDLVPDPVRRVAAPAIALFFLWGDLPFFLSRAGPTWFGTG